MKKFIFLTSFLLFCLIYYPALAGNIPGEIIFASEERSNATNRDGTGLYWDIFRAVYSSMGIKTKIIIVSGADPATKKKIGGENISGILGKPFTRKSLTKTIEKVLSEANEQLAF